MMTYVLVEPLLPRQQVCGVVVGPLFVVVVGPPPPQPASMSGTEKMVIVERKARRYFMFKPSDEWWVDLKL